MDIKCFILCLLSLHFAARGEAFSGQGGGPRNRIPRWCPEGSPIQRCLVNPCDVETCSSFPDAVCLNDNPCEPSCNGSFYVEGRPRLSWAECQGQGQGSSGIPEWCQPGSPLIRCLAPPCQSMRCRAFPQARCFADNPCEPSCSGNFYLGRRRLTRSECRRRRRQ